jgi:hypothetical protein
MDDLIRRIEFRPFSYEADPEYVVDMHRSFEVLEGSWFDTEETCRYYQKMVLKALGSSWVISIARAVIGYADLLPLEKGTGFVPRLRLHADYRHPKVTRTLLKGLVAEAKKREYTALVFFADTSEVADELEKSAITKDRPYKWANLLDLETSQTFSTREHEGNRFELLNTPFLPYLGSPLPPNFVIWRSFLAADYGVFNFHHPHFHEILIEDSTYVSCFDGREWFVFRQNKHPEDGNRIRAVLEALSSLSHGRILLSGKALEKSGLTAVTEETLWDFFLEPLSL